MNSMISSSATLQVSPRTLVPIPSPLRRDFPPRSSTPPHSNRGSGGHPNRRTPSSDSDPHLRDHRLGSLRLFFESLCTPWSTVSSTAIPLDADPEELEELEAAPPDDIRFSGAFSDAQLWSSSASPLRRPFADHVL